jgi:2',3'-cyclic-nucleotide 2'-phosphodiesterase (5'-nucleotidase family)
MAQSVPVALRILHTNDMHGTLNHAIFERLQQIRSACDLYFDTGDAIKTGNLGIPVKPEPVWPMLETLHCTASVPGNRESHVLESALQAKLKGANHPILCANLRERDGSNPLPKTLILTQNGIRIGLVGVMVPMVTQRMVTQAVSAYLWDPPIPAAIKEAEKLKPHVDLLIALTHIGYREDLRLARIGEFQIIFGGHSHTVMPQPELHGKTWVCQGGSHNRYAGVYEWDGTLKGGLQPLKP